jgi:AAA domain
LSVSLPVLPPPPSVAVATADRTGCPVCGSDSCEEHLPRSNGNGRPFDDALRQQASRGRQILRETERLRVRRAAQRELDAEERGPIIPPHIVTLSDLLNEPDPAIAWRLDAWQPAETRVMLSAARKVGKTTLTGSLVRSLVDGEPWLGRYEVQAIQGTVTVIDTEMSRRQLRRWYRDLGIARTTHVRIIPLRGQGALFDVLNPVRRAGG